jgi:phytoene dehydrogenase-like protein
LSARSASADIVVAGAGHNSLITAAYLSKAGHRCLVLDARPVPGGGVASEELLLPGFQLDSCSTGHTLIQTNPVIADDELGLIAEHGLAYIEPDPVAHVVFPDGESLTMWLDLERTCEEIARFSAVDAQAYRRLLAEYDAVKDVFRAYPGWGVASRAALAFLNAIRPLASISRARWLLSFLDQRIRSARLRFSQEWHASTTQRLARQPGVASLSLISSPRARMCGV